MLTGRLHAESNFYVGGSVGAYFREDETTTLTGLPISVPFRREFDPGETFNLSVGYKLPYRLRLEAEIGYSHNTVSKDVYGGPFPATVKWTSGTDGNQYLGTLNMFYDLPFGDRAVPYIGGGIGGGHTQAMSGTGFDNFGNLYRYAGGGATRGVGLVEGGLTVAISDSLSLVPAYRYMRVFGGVGLGNDQAAHVVKLGFRYSF